MGKLEVFSEYAQPVYQVILEDTCRVIFTEVIFTEACHPSLSLSILKKHLWVPTVDCESIVSKHSHFVFVCFFTVRGGGGGGGGGGRVKGITFDAIKERERGNFITAAMYTSVPIAVHV